MKKITAILAALLMAASVFAAGSVTVKKVTGQVTFETAPGKKKNVKKDQVLEANTVINTGFGATLTIVKEDGTEVKISSNKKGTVEDLLADSTTAANGLRTNPGKNTIAAASDTTGKGEQTLAERNTVKNASVSGEIDED